MAPNSIALLWELLKLLRALVFIPIAFTLYHITEDVSDDCGLFRDNTTVTTRQERSSSRHSCQHCERIVINVSVKSLQFGYTLRLPHTRSEAARALLDGCPLFKCFIEKSRAMNTPDYVDLLEDITNRVSRVSRDSGLSRWKYFLFALSERPYLIRFHEETFERDGEQLKEMWARLVTGVSAGVEMLVSADSDDPAATEVPHRPINYKVCSQDSFDLAKQWIQECRVDAGHAICRRTDARFVPTRLIDVGTDCVANTAKLVVSESLISDVTWVSLSYCWGGDQTFKTTAVTLKHKQIGIDISDLPQTIKDAIHVARKLGIRYIWIDSLCIIQDDDLDKAREIAALPDIYKHGLLTISASCAASVREGFLHDRTDPPGSSEIIQLPYNSEDGRRGKLNISRRHAEGQSGDEPINRRAWTLQERMLSTRVLDYGSRQLHWICKSKTYRDGGAGLVYHPGHDGRGSQGVHTILTAKASGAGTDNSPWADIVSKYSHRQITFYWDRLPALSAIAQEYHGLCGDKYLAGLWKSALAEQLAWAVGRPRKTRPPKYNAPSWSWAAITEAFWIYSSQGLAALEVLDSNVQPRHDIAPFGEVVDGFLKLRGTMVQGHWYAHRERIDLIQADQAFLVTNDRNALERDERYGTTAFLGWMYQDALEPDWPSGKDAYKVVWCLRLKHRNQKRGSLCLLLEKQAVEGQYKRVGILELGDAKYRHDPPMEWDVFAGIAPEIITLL